MKKWKIGTSCFLLVALIVTLGVAFATDNAAQSGTRNDPLVSRSYLEALNAPMVQEMTNELRDVTDRLIYDLEIRQEQLIREIDNTIIQMLLEEGDIDLRDPEFIEIIVRAVIEQFDAVPDGEVGGVLFSRVELNNGQTVRANGNDGVEVVLRRGSAVATGANDPAMVSLTTGNSLNDGTALVENNLYLVTIGNNGFRATENNTIAFVRGAHIVE